MSLHEVAWERFDEWLVKLQEKGNTTVTIEGVKEEHATIITELSEKSRKWAEELRKELDNVNKSKKSI